MTLKHKKEAMTVESLIATHVEEKARNKVCLVPTTNMNRVPLMLMWWVASMVVAARTGRSRPNKTLDLRRRRRKNLLDLCVANLSTLLGNAARGKARKVVVRKMQM